MKTIAPLCIIPARGNSPDLPKKNLKMIGGKPLVAHTILSAVECPELNDVFVSTEDDRIAGIAREYGAKVPFRRPNNLTSKDVSIGPVIKHAAETISEVVDKIELTENTPIIVLQPNVPFRRTNDIQRALSKYKRLKTDTLISVVRQSEFFWREQGVQMESVISSREGLRENFEPIYKETGSITITTIDRLRNGQWTGNHPGYIVTDALSSFRVNKLVDFWLAERIASGIKIVFRVDGGDGLGLGKVYRTITLATELDGIFNCDITFVSDTNYQIGIEVIKSHGYAVREIPDKRKDIDTITAIEPDIIFIDVEDSTDEYFEPLNNISAAIVNFENLKIKHADFAVNPQRYFENPEIHNNLNGPNYLIIRNEFTEITPKISENAEKVLITFGGTDPLGLTIECVRAVGGAVLPFEYKVILGPGFDKEDALYALPDETISQFEIKRDVSNMADFMAWADIAISGGGRTVYELAATGTPSIVIAQNNGEIERTELLREQGAIEFLGHGTTVDGNEIVDRLTDIAQDTDRRRLLSKRGQKIVDGRGIDRILKLISKLIIEN